MATQSAPTTSNQMYGGVSPGGGGNDHHVRGGTGIGSFAGAQKDPLLSSGNVHVHCTCHTGEGPSCMWESNRMCGTVSSVC